MRTLLLMTVVALALAVQPAPAMAQPQERAAQSVQRVSLDQAVAIAQRRVEGRVIGADTRHHRGRIVHEVRILDERGHLHIVRVDGETGRVWR